MKTTPLLRAVVLGGGVTLLANPLWAGGGAQSYDRNQAGQERMKHSGAQVSNLEQGKKKEIEQALQDKGFKPGSVDGVIDSQRQAAISQFQRDNNLPATGMVDQMTAEQLGVEITPSPRSQGQRMERSEGQRNLGSGGMPPSNRVQ